MDRGRPGAGGSPGAGLRRLPGRSAERALARYDRRPPGVAASARQAGLRLGLENHDHGAFTPTAAEFLRVLREVDAPELLPLIDTGNFVDGWPSLEATLPGATHVHAKFWQVNPDGSDARVDYGRLFPVLRAAGYRGWVTFEYEAEESERTGIPRAMAFLRRMTLAG